MNVDQQVRDELRAHAARVELALPPAGDVLDRARRQTRRTRLALVAAVVAVLGVGVWLAGPSAPRVDVVDGSPRRDAAVRIIEPVLLDGTRLRLALPAQIVAEADQARRWSVSLHVASSLEAIGSDTTGWALDVHRGELDELLPDSLPLELPDDVRADAARLQPGAVLGLQFGPWVAVIAGDVLTDDHVELLLDAVDLTETPDGDVTYSGSLLVWQVDGPELQLLDRQTAVSMFLRPCSLPATTRTASGLTVERIDDPDRGTHLTVLCRDDLPLEIWLDTPAPLDGAALANVDAQILTVGSVLSAVRAGRSPGARPGTGGSVSLDALVADWTGPDGELASRGPRSFEVRSLRGADHCGWESVVFLSVAWPIGSSMETAQGDTSADIRQYIRDADHVLDGPDLLGELDLHTALPTGAQPTGYRLPNAELWLGADDGDSYVYIELHDGTVERWPRASEPVACS